MNVDNLHAGAKVYQHRKSELSAPHTGKLIDQKMLDRGIPILEVARRMMRNHSSVSPFLKRSSIQTAVLWELCHALNHNFFAEMANQLPSAYRCDSNSAQEEELKRLRIENELLKELLSGKR